MIQPTDDELQTPATAAAGRASFDDDVAWLAVMLAITAAEACWWAANWQFGTAPAPYLFTYVALALVGLGAALALRFAIEPGAPAPNWRSVIPATVMIGAGASLFLPL